MPVTDHIELRSGAAVAVIDAARGGSVRAFSGVSGGQRRQWFYPDQDLPVSFPLVPWCSRVREGRFSYAGQKVQLINTGDEPHPIHGHGWCARWQVLEAEACRARLRFAYAAADWPWSYEVDQEFLLTDHALCINMSVINKADTVMPLALGWHPFFTLTPAMRVRAPVNTAWAMDAEGFPLTRSSVDRSSALPDGVPVRQLQLDTIFGLASGPVEIEWPEWQAALRMRMSANLTHLVIWTPQSQPYACFEPVTGTVHTQSLIPLQPGELCTAGVVFEVSSLAAAEKQKDAIVNA
ncbi:MAG: hypothetical protein AAF993_09585 [Pseudomonadota bacterium]